MNVNVTLRHGPLDIELEADSEEEYEKEILGIASFLKENEEELEVLAGLTRPADGNPRGNDDGTWQTYLNERPGSASAETSELTPETADLFSSVSHRTDEDPETLARIFDVPSDAEEDDFPAIFSEEFEEGVEVFGSSKTERQARGSLVLLFRLW